MAVDPVHADPRDAAELIGLADPLPSSPFPTVERWLDSAWEERITPNPNAIALATIDGDGTPSVRMVLCRKIVHDPGFIVFYTNRNSRKGRALDANPHAAACFHWDAYDKQARVEGPVVPSPAWESDEYFASRTPAKRIGAWASDQSDGLASRETLVEKLRETRRRFGLDPDASEDEINESGVEIPRPPHWGGFRIWAACVELWVGQRSRLHDRAVWSRTLTPVQDASGEVSFDAEPWQARRLQP